jgi:putative hemolysin
LEQSIPNNTLRINIRDAIRAKAPNSKIPGFLIKYLEHIVHQDEINGFLKRSGHLIGIEFIEEAMRFLNIKVETEGLDELPEGRFTFAGNHPLGGIDGMATGLYVHYRYPNQSIKFLSNDILSNLQSLLPLFIPVNKVGNQSQHRTLPQRVTEAYSSNTQMVIFPAGICSRRIKGKVTELQWQKSFIVKSIESGRDIIPVYFEGQNSNFFYRLANLRKFLNIKINIEMLYLVDEMFKQRGRTFKIIYGKPIPCSKLDNSRSHLEWAEYVRQQAMALGSKKK